VRFEVRRDRGISLALLLLGVALRVIYLSYTGPSERTFDVFEGGGHLDYIRYVATHWMPPPATMGWEFHQPPLYYYIAAPVFLSVRGLFPGSELIALQLLSLAASIIFLVFGCRTIRLFVQQPWLQVLSQTLLVVWPAAVIHSVRLGPDALFYAAYASSFFYLCRWFLNGSRADLRWCLLLAVVTALVRSNGVVLAGTVASTVLVAAWGRRDLSLSWREAFAGVAVLALGALGSFAGKLYGYFFDSGHLLVGGVLDTLNPGLRVGNGLENFIHFDLSAFLTVPFLNTWADLGGRQLFWNFLLKSALFSEFSFPGATSQFLAVGMSALFLILVVGTAVVLVSDAVTGACGRGDLCARTLSRSLPLLVGFILSLVALLIYRYAIPVSCNNDLRYILPILIPAIIAVASAIASVERRFGTRSSLLAALAPVSFILSSCFFFLLPLLLGPD
jgi:hypothetical protein